jgi:hypothetical protein
VRAALRVAEKTDAGLTCSRKRCPLRTAVQVSTASSSKTATLAALCAAAFQSGRSNSEYFQIVAKDSSVATELTVIFEPMPPTLAGAHQIQRDPSRPGAGDLMAVFETRGTSQRCDELGMKFRTED